jgi:hypothetical protein
MDKREAVLKDGLALEAGQDRNGHALGQAWTPGGLGGGHVCWRVRTLRKSRYYYRSNHDIITKKCPNGSC